MKKILILILSCCFFVACSHEDFVESIIDSNGAQSRAAADIFKVKPLVYPEEYGCWADAYRGVDNEGNFYLIDDANGIIKYDYQLDKVSVLAPFESFLSMYGQFCFDERNNFCYVIYENGQYSLRRISPDGNMVFDQVLDLPSIESENEWRPYYFNCGICAAPNGNIFMLFESGGYSNYEISYYKLSAQDGAFTKLDLNLTGSINEHTQLHKASGAIQYLITAWGNSCLKINTNTSQIDIINTRFTFGWRDMTACTSKANLYAVKGRQIVMVRPNAATDLIIGSIPNKYKNSNGEIVELGSISELFMNSDASIFYVRASNVGFVKLTLE